MKQTQKFTAIIELEDDSYVSLCPELDIASQGSMIEEDELPRISHPKCDH